THRAVGDELGQRLPLRALTDALAPDAASEIAVVLQANGTHRASGASGNDERAPDTDGFAPATDAVPAAVERLLVVIDRLCAGAPRVPAFDALRWADEASLLAWHGLSGAVDQIPLLLVSAPRPVRVRPAVARLRRGVVSRRATVLSLGPLPADDVYG